jgi:hypothetical protein
MRRKVDSEHRTGRNQAVQYSQPYEAGHEQSFAHGEIDRSVWTEHWSYKVHPGIHRASFLYEVLIRSVTDEDHFKIRQPLSDQAACPDEKVEALPWIHAATKHRDGISKNSESGPRTREIVRQQCPES